jgi:hypothetical protein
MQIAEHFHLSNLPDLYATSAYIIRIHCEHPLINLALYLERCAQEQCVHCFTTVIAFPVAKNPVMHWIIRVCNAYSMKTKLRIFSKRLFSSMILPITMPGATKLYRLRAMFYNQSHVTT